MNLEDFQTEFEKGAVMNKYRVLFKLSMFVGLPICLIRKLIVDSGVIFNLA